MDGMLQKHWGGKYHKSSTEKQQPLIKRQAGGERASCRRGDRRAGKRSPGQTPEPPKAVLTILDLHGSLGGDK